MLSPHAQPVPATQKVCNEWEPNGINCLGKEGEGRPALEQPCDRSNGELRLAPVSAGMRTSFLPSVRRSSAHRQKVRGAPPATLVVLNIFPSLKGPRNL